MSRRRAEPAILLALALLAASAAAAAPPPPLPACDPSLNPCERLSWVEQRMWLREKESIPAIREVAVADPHERVRERSVGALVILGDKGAADIFLDRLANDPSPAVRRAAAEGVGLLKLAVPPARLVSPLQKDRYPLVRAECARAIGRTGLRKVVPQLMVSALQDPSPEVRALSAEAIALLRVQQGLETLRHTALQDEAPIVRFYALRGLVENDAAASFPVFKEVFENTSEPELRVEAFRGILSSRNLDEWRSVGLADADPRIRFLAFRDRIARMPVTSGLHPSQTAFMIEQMEPYLNDRVRGIRDLAKEYLEKLGVKVRQSGFTYAIEK